VKITSLFLKNKTRFSLTNTHIFLLFLCKIPLFYTVSLSLITVYNFWICFMHLKQLLGGTILIIIWLIPLFWLLVVLNIAWDLLGNSLCHSLVTTTTHQKRRRRLLALAVQQTAGRETLLPMLSVRIAETISGLIRRRCRTRKIKPREKLRPRGLRLWKKAYLHLCWVCHMVPQWLTAQMAAWSLYTGNMRAASCKQAGPHWARRNQWTWQII